MLRVSGERRRRTHASSKSPPTSCTGPGAEQPHFGVTGGIIFICPGHATASEWAHPESASSVTVGNVAHSAGKNAVHVVQTHESSPQAGTPEIRFQLKTGANAVEPAVARPTPKPSTSGQPHA